MSSRRSWVLATVALAILNGCSLAPVASPNPGVPTAAPGSPTAATPSPTSAPTPTAITSPTASPSPIAPPSPIRLDSSWDLQRVADGLTGTVSLAIDNAGIAHVVATTKQGIAYWTNESGTWARQRIGLPSDDGPSDRSPAIAVSGSGDIVVAYERSSCFQVGCSGAHVFVTVRTSSGWTSPALVAEGIGPSLATRDGVIGVVYRAIGRFSDEACEEPVPIDYAVLSGDTWVIERVTENGWNGLLAYGPGATPHVVLSNVCGFLGEDGIYLAVADDSGSSFALEPIPGTSQDNNRAYAAAVDDSGRTHLLFVHDDDDTAQSLYTVRDPSGWAAPLEPLPGRSVRWMAVEGAGHIHVVGQDAEGAWHATNRSGAITFDHVSSDFVGYINVAVALDAAGRPHVLFRTDPEGGSPAIWYGTQTAP